MVLRDAKGHFISSKKDVECVQSNLSKSNIISKKYVEMIQGSSPKSKRNAKGHFISNKSHNAFTVTKTKSVTVMETKTLENKPLTKTLPFKPEKQVVPDKPDTLYLWVTPKEHLGITTMSEVTGEHKILAALHDPKQSIISLKRAIKRAEVAYGINNGIAFD